MASMQDYDSFVWFISNIGRIGKIIADLAVKASGSDFK